jgi:type VI protein secretion system component VasF
MSDTPTQREPPSKLDHVLAAHERRARLVAQLHTQAVATSRDLALRRKPRTTGLHEDRRRRKAEWLCMIIFLLALGGIAAVGCILCAAIPWR